MSLILPCDTESQLRRRLIPTKARGWRAVERRAAQVRLVVGGWPAEFITDADELTDDGRFDQLVQALRDCAAAAEQFDQPEVTLRYVSVPVDRRAEMRAALLVRREWLDPQSTAIAVKEKAFIDLALQVVPPPPPPSTEEAGNQNHAAAVVAT